ncbi:putative murein hydrolase (TIGR00659 family) [Palleronia aestuarii]|uniref:Putative murein hydrolase (TIGR00659 family) n=1 Tax=Palleronia aestuarii TaxID=568105 RepID=A0A2W7P0U3_9RHOB|nr:LrgB family protein [Palleronia aestuarii]PZX19076.1 putative murein hydrolase (TIGR00659 family) [Palleronia aestuarii]
MIEIWSYLRQEELLWLSATLVAYLCGTRLFELSGRSPLVNPVLVAIILLGATLILSGTSYATYFEGAQFVHFMLGPATVSLAVPLWVNRKRVGRVLLPMAAALVVGSMVALLSAVAMGMAIGLDRISLISLASKSVTAPVAIGITEELGGAPTLTAILVILTGIAGAIMVTPLLNLARLTDWRARGFSAGVAAHGIGTARAFQVNETAGTFSGIGMGLNAVLTALVAPLIVRLIL